MRRRAFRWLISCATLFLTVSGVAAGQQRAASAKNITGVWETKNAQSNSVLILNADGSGEFNGKELQWAVSGATLSLTFEGGSTYPYSIVLAGNNLTVSSPDLKLPMRFTRSGAGGGGESANPLAGGGMATPGAGAKPAGVAKSRPGAGPVGHWETATESGVIHLIMNPDGSGTFGQGSVRWSFSQGVLTLTGPNGKPIPYPASIGPDTMTLTDSTSGAALSFRRSGGGGFAGGGQTPPSRGGFGGGGAAEGDEGSEEGDDEGGFPGPAPGGLGGTSGGGPRGGAASGGGLVGSWRNQQGMTLQFNADGSAVLNGQRYNYTSDGSTITLIASDGQMPFPYSLSGNTLTVMVQGQPVAYTRAGGAGGGGSRKPGGFGGFGGGGGGSNPPEMVGKWCWINVSNSGQVSSSSNTCFVLNADGTYEYSGESSNSNAYGGTASQSSDGGTWSVEGSTIVANSRSQGRVVYQLEKRNNKNNDPMLCLDGSCFVTYGQNPPWPY